MWTEIGIVAYLAIGTFNLYKAVQIMNHLKVQERSPTVQRIWQIYEQAPLFVLGGLFIATVFLWLPLGIFMTFFGDKNVQEETEKEAGEIAEILKDGG